MGKWEGIGISHFIPGLGYQGNSGSAANSVL